MRSVSIDDLSPLGPPISNGAGRVYILNSVAVFVFVAAYTTRPLFLTRLSTALLAGNIYLLLTMPDILGHIPGLDPLIANFVVAWWMRAVDLFFLRDESRVLAKKYAHDGDDDRRAPRFELMTPTRAFDYLVVNHRLIGTPYQARGIQPFDKSRPHWTPTRTQFLRLKLNHLLISYLTLDLLVTQQPAPPARLFARDQEFFFSRLHEVTLEELSFRWLTHFNLWASCTCLIQYIYAIVAIIGVGSSLYEPGDFPPLLGDIREETSVRNHWGRVWHQIFQVPYLAFARAIGKVLPSFLTSSRLARRYTTSLLVFIFSGLAHAVQPIGVTGGWPQIRQFFFYFPVQAFAMVIEDAWWAVYSRRRTRGKDTPLSWWEKLLGFLWLQAWMSWTCSIWVYPTLRRGGEGMMPYSILTRAKQWLLKGKY